MTVQGRRLAMGTSGPESVVKQLQIRHALPSDTASWEALRRDLWPHGAADHGPEIASFFAGTLEEPAAVLVAEVPGTAMVGFAELSIRTDVPGLEGKRVGYVEGLYVRAEFRGRGIASRLLQASRRWAHRETCVAFAGDRADRIIVDRSFRKCR